METVQMGEKTIIQNKNNISDKNFRIHKKAVQICNIGTNLIIVSIAIFIIAVVVFCLQIQLCSQATTPFNILILRHNV